MPHGGRECGESSPGCLVPGDYAVFCPLCHAEYREAFDRCKDCDVELVSTLPDLQPGERSPEQVSHGSFLAWFLPMAAFYVFCVSAFSQAPWFTYPPVLLAMLLMVLIANFGCFWMMYQAIRYEQKVLKYVAYSLVPFLFIWYYQERYRNRKETQGLPVELR